MRSVVKHYAQSRNVAPNFHLLVSDVPVEQCKKATSVRLAQLPQWLNTSQIGHWRHGKSSLSTWYHAELFDSYSGSIFHSYAIGRWLTSFCMPSSDVIHFLRNCPWESSYPFGTLVSSPRSIILCGVRWLSITASFIPKCVHGWYYTTGKWRESGALIPSYHIERWLLPGFLAPSCRFLHKWSVASILEN